MMSDGLLILGMHRSGTSAVAGQLAALGLYPGRDLLPAQADNPKGFFEPRAVVELHDEILKMFGATWDDPRPLPEGWMQQKVLAPYRERLKALIQSEYGGSENWLVKDPRLCRLLPLLRAVLSELGASPKLLLVVREPGEVVASLARRSKTDPEQAASLWVDHYAEAEIASRGMPRAVVLYEDWLDDWRGEAARISVALGLALNIAADEPGFVDPGLRHPMAPGLHLKAPQNAWAMQLYDALSAWRRDAMNPGELIDQAAEDIRLAAKAALPVLAYTREADARAHAAHMRVLQAGGAAPVTNIFIEHFAREQERATAKANLLAHERLILIKQMQASASWRVTRPLRGLRRLLRG